MRHRTPPTRSRVIKPQCETAARSPLQPFDAASLGLPSERVQDVSAAAPLHAPATTTPRKRLAPRVPKPDPWLLLRQLKIILDEGQPELWAPDFGGCDNRGLCGGLKDRECRLDTSHLGPCICSFLDIDDILALHERDVMEWGQSRRSFARTSDDERLRVFGVSLREVSIYASATRIFGGHQHDLPIVVFSCVEELFRTGIYRKGLFRDLPNRERLIRLIRIFDFRRSTGGGESKMSSSFGEDFSLRAESMPDICALFSTYISSLPEPILCPTLFDAFWVWCVKPSLLRNDDKREAYGTHVDRGEALNQHDSLAHICKSPNRRARISCDSAMSPRSDESTQIRIAQILLALLPSANFSLLVYLFSFFTQVPLSSENGIGFEDIARIFARSVLGRPRDRDRRHSHDRNVSELGRSSDDTGIARRMMVWLLRRWGEIAHGLMQIGVDEDGNRGPSAAVWPDQPILQTEPESSGPSSPGDESDFPLLARPVDEDNTKVLSEDLLSTEAKCAGLLPSDRLFESDDASMCSSTALDERLLDITPPTFFLERALSLSDTTSLSPADQHILDLQREVDRSNLAVADACAARADAQLLAGRVAELEEQRDRAWGDVGGCDVEALKARLEIVERERDEALGLVRDAKKLFEAGVVGMFRIPV